MWKPQQHLPMCPPASHSPTASTTSATTTQAMTPVPAAPNPCRAIVHHAATSTASPG